MQLILLLALLLWGGGTAAGKNNGLDELLEPETVELIKQITGGDRQVEAFINEVKEISEAVSVIAPLAQSLKSAGSESAEAVAQSPSDAAKPLDISEILKPVRNIADDGVYNALARAIRT